MEIIPESLLIRKIIATSTHSPIGIVASNALRLASVVAKHISEQSGKTKEILTSIDSPQTTESIISIMDQLGNISVNGNLLINLTYVLVIVFLVGLIALVTTGIIYFAKKSKSERTKAQGKHSDAPIHIIAQNGLTFDSLESTHIENSISDRLPQCPNDTGKLYNVNKQKQYLYYKENSFIFETNFVYNTYI